MDDGDYYYNKMFKKKITQKHNNFNGYCSRLFLVLQLLLFNLPQKPCAFH